MHYEELFSFIDSCLDIPNHFACLVCVGSFFDENPTFTAHSANEARASSDDSRVCVVEVKGLGNFGLEGNVLEACKLVLAHSNHEASELNNIRSLYSEIKMDKNNNVVEGFFKEKEINLNSEIFH
jgi:hypothetical protein